MAHFLVLRFLPFIIWYAFINTHPLDLLKDDTSAIVITGEECSTNQGHSGLCMDMGICHGLFPPHDSISGNCSRKDTTGKTTACCFLSPENEEEEEYNGTQKGKREVPPPPPDTPNLHVRGCGFKRSLTEFVLGGRKADSWPWMASIFVKSEGATESRFICGGTIINKHFILTAAHCFGQRGRTVPATSVTVRVGAIKNTEGTEFHVSHITVHGHYRDNLHYDDIALLKTSKIIEEKHVVPVCLPAPRMYNAHFHHRETTILGWGDVSYEGKASDDLMEATLSIVPTRICYRHYQRLAPLSLPRGIIDTQMCAGSEDGSKDACQGDSGGPLLLEDRAGKWHVIGIVSFGYRCGEPYYPGVYTRVAKYLKWLHRHTDILPHVARRVAEET